MTPKEIIDAIGLIQALALSVAGVFVYFMGKEIKLVKTQYDSELKAMWAEINSLREAIDNANEVSSRYASRLQEVVGRIDRMPEDLRSKFTPADRTSDILASLTELRADRGNLWREMEAIRTELRMRRERNR